MKLLQKGLVILSAVVMCGFIFGRVLYHHPYWEDVTARLSQARIPAAGSPGFLAFPAGSATLAYHFDDASDECLDTTMQFPHSYKVNTAISCHVHWSPLTNSTNKVVWQIDYSLSAIGGTYGASTQIFVQTPGGGVADVHQVADFPDIACASCGISTVAQIHFCRDANGTNAVDDMVGDVVAHYFDCHVQLDTPGSWSEYVK